MHGRVGLMEVPIKDDLSQSFETLLALHHVALCHHCDLSETMRQSLQTSHYLSLEGIGARMQQARLSF